MVASPARCFTHHVVLEHIAGLAPDGDAGGRSCESQRRESRPDPQSQQAIGNVGNQVTDANGVASGPFYQPASNFVPPVGWIYTYTKPAGTVGQYTLNGATAVGGDMPPPGITFP